MKLTVCIGSSCHTKGSREVVEQFQQLIAQHGLDGSVELAGTFCMGRCREGVCVTLDNEFYSVTPKTAEPFFKKYILREENE